MDPDVSRKWTLQQYKLWTDPRSSTLGGSTFYWRIEVWATGPKGGGPEAQRGSEDSLLYRSPKRIKGLPRAQRKLRKTRAQWDGFPVWIELVFDGASGR
jgi:hypothetical protein